MLKFSVFILACAVIASCGAQTQSKSRDTQGNNRVLNNFYYSGLYPIGLKRTHHLNVRITNQSRIFQVH